MQPSELDTTRDGMSAPASNNEEGSASATAETFGVSGGAPLVVYCSNYAVAF